MAIADLWLGNSSCRVEAFGAWGSSAGGMNNRSGGVGVSIGTNEVIPQKGVTPSSSAFLETNRELAIVLLSRQSSVPSICRCRRCFQESGRSFPRH